MHDTELTRRRFIQRGATVGAVTVGAGYLLVGCGGQTGESGDGAATALSCNDLTGLTPEQITTRESLVYVEASELPDKLCSNCQQYQVPAEAGTCGTCLVVPGPINPNGHCTAWVQKTT